MATYFITLGCCWASAWYQSFANKRQVALEFVVTAMLVAIAGLRFETGYDWWGYQKYFADIPTFGELLRYGDWSAFGHMEPLYGVLNSLVKSVGLPFQAVLVLVAAFNGFAILAFLRRHSTNTLLCLAVYLSWVFLKLQMGGVRQSLSCSMVLFALTALVDDRPRRYVMFVLLAMGFQVSAAVFLPLGALLTARFSRPTVDVVLLVGVVVFLTGLDVTSVLKPVLDLVSIGFISTKLDHYFGGALTAPPAINYAYTGGGIIFLLGVRRALNGSAGRSDLVFYNLSVALVVVQLYCWQMPWFWNRMFYFTILPQACLLARVVALLRPQMRIGMLACVGAASVLVFGYFLTRPIKSLPYVPYQSYATYLATGDYGDGDARTIDYYRAVAHSKDR